MQTAAKAISSNLFTCSKLPNGTRRMVAEMSDIPDWPAPVYTESKRHYVDVKSERTGKVQKFVYLNELRDDEGDLQVVIFRAYNDMGEKIELHILND